MRPRVEGLIRRAYPEGVYSKRDQTLLDKTVAVEDARGVSQKVIALNKGEVEFSWAKDYDICYNINISHPDVATVFRHLRSNRSHRGVTGASRTLVLLSRLDRYYTVEWNVVRIKNDGPVIEFASKPPDEDLRHFQVEVERILNKAGFDGLSLQETGELVPWLQAGDSIVEGGIVTVRHCLFSEI